MREYADQPLVFDEIPGWLHSSIRGGLIKPEFRSEDYWYFVVQTPDGVVDATPGDLIVRDLNGNLSVYDKRRPRQ